MNKSKMIGINSETSYCQFMSTLKEKIQLLPLFLFFGGAFILYLNVALFIAKLPDISSPFLSQIQLAVASLFFAIKGAQCFIWPELTTKTHLENAVELQYFFKRLGIPINPKQLFKLIRHFRIRVYAVDKFLGVDTGTIKNARCLHFILFLEFFHREFFYCLSGQNKLYLNNEQALWLENNKEAIISILFPHIQRLARNHEVSTSNTIEISQDISPNEDPIHTITLDKVTCINNETSLVAETINLSQEEKSATGHPEYNWSTLKNDNDRVSFIRLYRQKRDSSSDAEIKQLYEAFALRLEAKDWREIHKCLYPQIVIDEKKSTGRANVCRAFETRGINILEADDLPVLVELFPGYHLRYIKYCNAKIKQQKK